MAMTDPAGSCAEHGVWTPLPPPPPRELTLSLEQIAPLEHERVSKAGQMSLHIVGCSGNDPAIEVSSLAEEMSRQRETSFLYHLGDITYVEEGTAGNQRRLYNQQLLRPFSHYPAPIVAIAGNHDGKGASRKNRSAAETFMANFCADEASWPAPWQHNHTDPRPAMIQPYPYWLFDTPVASIVGLYANISNGGILDDPAAHPDFTTGPQYRWLVEQLRALRARNETLVKPRAVLLAVHYPPYSGASNFTVRGDPHRGETPGQEQAPYLGAALQAAFSDAGQRPDAIFSAHAHLYQRLTYRYADGTVMPCVIAGSGGHSLERLFERCDGGLDRRQAVPFPAVTPEGFAFPEGDSAAVEAYADTDRIAVAGRTRKRGTYGFLRVTIDGRRLTAEFFRKNGKAADAFTLDLDRRRYIESEAAA